MESISGVLTRVTDWKRLAGLLNVGNSDILADCAQDLAQASCFRREVVRRYCNSQHSEDSSKVAEDIAKVLEQIGHNLQAKELRKLFGKSAAKLSSPLARDGMPPTSHHLGYESIGWYKK